MARKRIFRIILFLIIIFLFSQLIPSNLNSIERFQSHSQNHKVLLPPNSFIRDILFIGNESNKTLFKNLSIKFSLNSIFLMFIVGIYLVNLFFQKKPFDYRKSIRQSISHYFYGSKYFSLS